MRKICVFTGTRAEYGLLKPLMDGIVRDDALCLQLVVTGMHLSYEFGMTHRLIAKDGFYIDEKVEILLGSDTPVAISKAMGLGIIGYAEALGRLRPDLVVLLGDRFECLAAACACLNARVPVAHIHGGEVTAGAVDEAFRHAITKMSHLHFTSTTEYRERVVQLGEDPSRVFHVGGIGIENIRRLPVPDREELEKAIGFKLGARCLLVTFHPATTLPPEKTESDFNAILTAIHSIADAYGNLCRVIFTRVNADVGGRVINRLIDSYVSQNPGRAVAFASMGQLNYLGAMKHAAAVVGNSSSGILEAPAFKIPCVNVGDRQKGRVQDISVIDCEPDAASITAALEKAFSADFLRSLRNMQSRYEKPGTVLSILETIREANLDGIVQKTFHDLPQPGHKVDNGHNGCNSKGGA